MSLVTNWITKLPRLKNAKVARFSYKAEAYANDDIEGVENYDYSRDMNVPSATHTDFDPDVLSIGARTHFSSVPKNGLNHFFGRVSYNLNKVLDFLVDFLTDFIALNNSFISFTEIVSFSSSATLSNYANGTTKRLLSTAGSNITITLPVGETYLGSNTITLAPSIMLTITKRGTVWVNSSGNAITALTAYKWKTARNVTISDADGTNIGTAVSVDGSENETLKLPPTIKATIAGKSKYSYPIPTDAVLQYSFDEIKQLPDNPTGTVYKKDNDWTTVDGWYGVHTSLALSVENQSLKVVYDGTRPDIGWSIQKDGANYNGKFIVGRIKSTVPIVSVSYYNGTSQVNLNLNKKTEYEAIFYGYVSSTHIRFILYMNHGQLTAKTCWIEYLYIGNGSYLEPVIDNSYSEAHAENHGVILVDGVCGKAGHFNNSYMIAPRPVLGDDITVYFWAKFDVRDVYDWQTIVQSRTVAGQGLSVFQIGSSYALHWRDNQSTFTGYNRPVDTWHHVCMKMNATTAVLKINGEIKSTLTGTYGTTQNLASTIWSGKSGTGGKPASNPLTGALDGLKIVPRFTTDDEDIGEYKARANLPKFYATADKWKTARNVTISDADGTNTGTAVSVDGSENETLKLPPTIKANLTGNVTGGITGNAGTADKWKTARNITISDADGTNTGIAVSVDGSENETLKLPATIKANLTGNADTASNANVRVSLRHSNIFYAKTWGGLTNFSGSQVWTDGENIYYRDGDGNASYVLNKATSTWVAKTWGGITSFYGSEVWTDGENIYFSFAAAQYVLNKATSTWVAKTWGGLTNFSGGDVWTDGETIYYSNAAAQYVLNKATSTWVAKTWGGLTNFGGAGVWTDGENIYRSYGTQQYVLNKATSTWVAKTWTGLTNFGGGGVWTDGENIYYSNAAAQYVLNKATSTWVAKTWGGLTNFSGGDVWTDGDNIYYNNGGTHYIMPATRHNYVDENKYQALFSVNTSCNLRTLSARFVFGNE